ncbi:MULTISPECIES: SDR family NAD(P)-dependent oxidoreductase [unclassified Sphingomonas]|uniref:SDR family NAD(P)-dependent oxidoreductase n=1 Tax=unclassified Sphingomonas TaxID=196159 RepID=UPI000831472F|nr:MULTISPECIES: SDR family oxidoreductase [unclassified Sphingomonas]
MSESINPARSIADSAVVITGGTSGVGLATARAFLEAACRKVVIVGRTIERGERVRSELAKHYPDAAITFVAADANEISGAAQVVEQALAALDGRIDVLVNSTAGSYVPALLFRTAAADIPSILTQQMMAPILMSHAVLPVMREQRSGVIVNIASDAAKVPTPGETVIGAAMAAIVTFSRTLAMEAKRDGIRVNVLTPSLIGNTPVYDRVMGDPFAAKLFGNAAKLASLGVAEPEDLAATILFLASPAAARLTGQAISVNGGVSAA